MARNSRTFFKRLLINVTVVIELLEHLIGDAIFLFYIKWGHLLEFVRKTIMNIKIETKRINRNFLQEFPMSTRVL